MKDLLTELDVLLKEKNTFYYKQIGMPIRQSVIIDLLNENNLYLCKEFIDLYSQKGWVDGETIYNGGYVEFCSLGCLVDLKYAIAKFLRDRNTENNFDGKFPIVERIDGSFMAVDLKKNSPTRGYIFAYEPDVNLTEKMVKIYDSIPLFIQSVVECYKQGVYVSDKGYLDVNFDKEYEISKRLNPNSIYWVDDIGEMLELLDEED